MIVDSIHKKTTIITIFFSFLLLSTDGQSADGSLTLIYQVAELDASRLAREFSYIPAVIVRLAGKSFALCRERVLTTQQQTGIQEQILTDRRRNIRDEISRLYEQRDQVLFNEQGGDPAYFTRQVSDIDAQVADKERELTASHFVPIPKTAILSFKEPNSAINSPLTAPALYCRDEQVDMLFYGSIQSYEQTLFLQMSLYDAIDNVVLQTEQIIFNYEELQESLPSFFSRFYSTFLGRDWSNLTISVRPEQALIYLDDRFVGLGKADLKLITAGSHSVTIEAPGHYTQTAAIELTVGEDNRYDYQLEEGAVSEITVISVPAAAELYDGINYIGETPVIYSYDRIGERKLTLVKEGYHRAFLYLSEESPKQVEINLHSSLFDMGNFRQAGRNRFYLSFALFFLSLPITFFTGSLAEETSALAADHYASSGYDDQTRDLLRDSRLYYSLQYFSISVNFFLLLNTVVDGIDYLKTGELNYHSY